MRKWFLLAIALAGHGAGASTMLDEYIELRVGSFSSADQAAVDERYDVAIWHVREIWTGDEERRWLYVESWLEDAEAPYMQRISSIADSGDGTLTSRRYTIGRPDDFLGAWKPGAEVPSRSAAKLSELAGCEAAIVRAGVQRFESATQGNRCKNRYKGASYALSRGVVTAEGMTNWDRGFDGDGNLVWGPAAGGYRFRPLDADRSCVKPVRMLVYGEISDRTKMRAYGQALAESGLYPRVNGYYEASTPALEVFEGEPPAGRGVIIARFPCLKAAQEFWYSDAYQAIRPLREGAAEFEVLVLPAPPLPAYLP